MRYGYARVSTSKQDCANQVDTLKAAGCNLIFTENERDGLWPVSPEKNVQNRRAIYLYNKRSVRLPLLSALIPGERLDAKAQFRQP